jgi:predicted nuclease of predicted toxin-antitoxin system
MLFLANENVPGAAVRALREAGHDVDWVREDSRGAKDLVVLARSAREGRLLLTFDKDFGDLVFHEGADASPGVIVVRAILAPEALAQLLLQTLGGRSDWAGHFSVVTANRVRMRPLPR